MKKILISLLSACMILSGCASKPKEKEDEKQEVVDEVFEKDDDLEKIKDEYDVEEVVYVDEENKNSIFDTIEAYIKDHKTEVVILAGAGIIIVSGVGYVFTNLAIAAAAITIIYDLAGEENIQEYIQVVEDNEHVQNIKEYFSTHTIEETINDGVNFMKDKIDQFQQNLGVDLPWLTQK